MGRIEHHQLERSTLEGQVAKIHEHIRLHFQGPAILAHVLLIADIPEQGVLVVFVEAEHGAATAGVENFYRTGHIGCSSWVNHLLSYSMKLNPYPGKFAPTVLVVLTGIMVNLEQVGAWAPDQIFAFVVRQILLY